MAGWASNRELVREEFNQATEEGKDPGEIEALRSEWLAAGDNEDLQAALHEKLLALPVRPDFPFQEPPDLGEIRALRPGNSPQPSLKLTDSELQDKLYGAWLGRCAGCALGKPAESLMATPNSWERQKKYLTAISLDEWPLRDYFPEHSPVEKETGSLGSPGSVRERIAFMESDDDIRYTVLGQIILKDFGADFSSFHVAGVWFDRLGYRHFCTAETQAYRNFVIRGDQFRSTPSLGKGREEDASSDWHWFTHHLNPYREWIGAQIRVDSYGYAAPGNPRLAAEFAWRDARISHVKNGIYGAMFCAAMIAASFAADDVHAIVNAGLAEIPSTSRLATDIRRTIAICKRHGFDSANFEAVFTDLHHALGHYSAIHTNNNASLCAAALLLSGGDFHRGITLAVMGGWDTDCNGATVGSIVGAITGGKNTPQHWVGRLNDTLNSYVVEYHPIAISECARRSFSIAKKILGT